MTTETGWHNEYLFKDCAGEKEKLEKAIVYVMRKCGIGNKTELVDIEFYGTSEQCLRINTDENAYITISCIETGIFLYCSVYRDVTTNRRNMPVDEIVATQKQNAIYNAVLYCCNTAFDMLGIAEKKVMG